MPDPAEILPPEVMQLIFKNLSASEMAKAEQVSTKWHDLVNKKEKIAKIYLEAKAHLDKRRTKLEEAKQAVATMNGSLAQKAGSGEKYGDAAKDIVQRLNEWEAKFLKWKNKMITIGKVLKSTKYTDKDDVANQKKLLKAMEDELDTMDSLLAAVERSKKLAASLK